MAPVKEAVMSSSAALALDAPGAPADSHASVLAVDRRPLVRAGLARLGAGALGCLARGVADLPEAAALLAATGYTPRALLIGVRRGQDPTPLVAEALRFGVPVICAFDDEDGPAARRALAAGADAHIVIEHADVPALRATLRRIEAGELASVPEVESGGRGAGADRERQIDQPAPVTQRSLEVLGSLADGLHDHEIAVRLGISTSSVRKHIASAQIRLRARTRTQAVATAAREGLL
jgi:DNA-binding NarL/FixJ family response regulator